jgi:hypothetical protein
MINTEITQLLSDPARPGAPEPTLLPWLARRAAPADLPAVARAAASVSLLAPRESGWPVIADAIASMIADRTHDPAALSEMLAILPPIAGRLDSEQSGRVIWARAKPDSVGYAVLADQLPTANLDVPVLQHLSWLIQQPLWASVLGARSSRWLPPLADLRSLAWYASSTARNRAAETDEEAVYLLPFRFAEDIDRGQAVQQRQAIGAVMTAVREGRHWYAAALISRAAPYFNEAGRSQIRAVITNLPGFWLDHVARLIQGHMSRWLSEEDELAASHPAVARLTELAATADPGELAEVCREETQHIVERYGLVNGWEPDDEDWELGAGVPELARQKVQSYRLGNGSQHLLEIVEPKPARFVNIYLAEAGEDQPVHGIPLMPDRDYDVCCNIGPADRCSLLDQESAEFPGELLPEAPLSLHAVLFVDGRMTADAIIELPAEGPSPWVRLRLPRSPAPTVIHAELAIYYDVAVVLVYSLTIPVGDVKDRGPEAKLQFRLSRSLTDLAKLAGRGMSVIVPGPGSAPAVYVNGLTFAPQEFSHNPDMVSDAAFAVREELYHAHFIVKQKGKEIGEDSRYVTTGDRPYEKSVADFCDDLRKLARCGADVYEQLFAHDDLPLRMRTEAEAFDRPPVLQVVSLGRERRPIPWAAIYDLPLSDKPNEYRLCRSIAEFGPGGNSAEAPARCPHEHREGESWKLNELCPWGFWGLSAIIEHPPSTEGRDLEVRAGHPEGPPVILMGYDTSLDPHLGDRHIDALRAQHGKALLEPQAESRVSVMGALKAAQMDILYFYCHIVTDRTRPGSDAPAIGLGADQLTAKDINGWARVFRPTRHPLVILNGCHSVEVGSGSLYNLVDPFINRFEACGLVGTEITIEQGLGGWAMELLLSSLRAYPVGTALRSVRWEMFRSGNLMGLAYTPYCLAGLTLVSRPKEEG